MNVSIIGTGYVGLITGVCFAELGNSVTCVDVIQEKVDMINRAEAPIFEEGLDALLKKNIGKNLKATMDLEDAVLNSDVTFICVGTPDAPGGGIDLKYIKSAAEGIGKALAKKGCYHVVVDKSTVVPGTTDSVILPILEKESGKKAGVDFGVGMNPEFLREGKAIEDFMKPDRIVIGVLDEDTEDVLVELYGDIECEQVATDLRTAEMIKYAANAFLATKISFINEIANICEGLGTDVVDVAEGIGMDHRISPKFLNAGIGYGGSCFPKDVKAIADMGRKQGYEPILLDSVMQVNKNQANHAIGILKEKLGGFEGKKVAVVGLAFKPGTDDLREGPALRVIEELLEGGAIVSACDPIAIENAKKVFEKVSYSEDLETCIEGADAAIIVTEWPEYRVAAKVFKDKMAGTVIVDGRRILDPGEAKSLGLDYFGIGYGK
jgi:UDPglucose 6-dehydrogenase